MTQHKNVYSALAAAQSEMGKVVKGSVNPAFKSKYADLSDVVSAVAPALNQNGLAFFHYMTRDEVARYMVTALVHGDSDTRIECPVELILGKNDMPGFKSATTYAKRIGLESVTGVAPEDDDGNDAAKNPPRATSRTFPRTPHDPETGEVVDTPRGITADQFMGLRDLMDRSAADETKFLAHFGIPSLDEMPAAKLASAEAMLLRKIADKAHA
jgi:hypothetical protein